MYDLFDDEHTKEVNTKMATKLTADQKEAATPAAFAKVIGVDPKRLRSKLRSSGIRVSENREGFDEAAKVMLIDHFSNKETKSDESPKTSGRKTTKAKTS